MKKLSFFIALLVLGTSAFSQSLEQEQRLVLDAIEMVKTYDKIEPKLLEGFRLDDQLTGLIAGYSTYFISSDARDDIENTREIFNGTRLPANNLPWHAQETGIARHIFHSYGRTYPFLQINISRRGRPANQETLRSIFKEMIEFGFDNRVRNRPFASFNEYLNPRSIAIALLENEYLVDYLKTRSQKSLINYLVLMTRRQRKLNAAFAQWENWYSHRKGVALFSLADTADRSDIFKDLSSDDVIKRDILPILKRRDLQSLIQGRLGAVGFIQLMALKEVGLETFERWGVDLGIEYLIHRRSIRVEGFEKLFRASKVQNRLNALMSEAKQILEQHKQEKSAVEKIVGANSKLKVRVDRRLFNRCILSGLGARQETAPGVVRDSFLSEEGSVTYFNADLTYSCENSRANIFTGYTPFSGKRRFTPIVLVSSKYIEFHGTEVGHVIYNPDSPGYSYDYDNAFESYGLHDFLVKLQGQRSRDFFPRFGAFRLGLRTGYVDVQEDFNLKIEGDQSGDLTITISPKG